MTYSGWLDKRLKAAHKEVKEWPSWEQKCSHLSNETNTAALSKDSKPVVKDKREE